MAANGNLRVRYRKLSELEPYPNNARTHSDEQIAQIMGSMQEFGFTNPILIDEKGGIIAGHGRLTAAQRLEMDEVPTITLKGLSEAQKRAYVIADNKLALNAGWDEELLGLELQNLLDMDFDIGLIGFSEQEINLFLPSGQGLTDPNAIPENVEQLTNYGDLWILGNHRLLCGDATNDSEIKSLFAGDVADLLFTSPPYVQQRDYGAAKDLISDWDKLMTGAFNSLPIKAGASVLVNLGLVHARGKVNCYWDNWLNFMGNNDWPLFAWYVWDQGSGMPGNWNGRLAPSHEFIFHFAKKPKQANKSVAKKSASITTNERGTTFRQKDGSTKKIYSSQASGQATKIADSVIRVNRNPSEAQKTNHPATFPTQLCEKIYESFAKRDDIIYEPFCGSGTSIIACERFDARSYSMEIDPGYCDIIVKRWEDFTGQKAVKDEAKAA